MFLSNASSKLLENRRYQFRSHSKPRVYVFREFVKGNAYSIQPTNRLTKLIDDAENSDL